MPCGLQQTFFNHERQIVGNSLRSHWGKSKLHKELNTMQLNKFFNLLPRYSTCIHVFVYTQQWKVQGYAWLNESLHRGDYATFEQGVHMLSVGVTECGSNGLM